MLYNKDTAQKMKFSLRISSVNVIKSAGNCGFWSHLLKKSFMENFSFCAIRVNIFSVMFKKLKPRPSEWPSEGQAKALV